MTERTFRHAVVTGGSSGIGRAIVERLTQGGTEVVAIGRDAARLEEVRAVASHGNVRPLIADLADERELERASASLARDFAELDLLIHAAGAYARATFAAGRSTDLDTQLAVNLKAPYQLTEALLPALERARGQIAFVNSSAVMRAQPMIGAYAASKAGLRALADSIREEVNLLGIRVISIFPGRTDTPMQVEVHRLEGRPYEPSRMLAADDVARALLNALEMPDGAEITEISIRPMRPPI